MKKKILIIEDDPAQAELAATALEDDAYEIVTAGDGNKGLDKAKDFKPDLAIIDLMLPGMLGIAVVKRIRADENLKSARILVVSSKPFKDTQEDAREAGADDYLVKPYDLSELKKRVQKLIG